MLGIDPGSVNTGWAFLKSNGRKIHLVSSGVLAFDAKTPFLERLTEIRISAKELLSELRPDAIALESLIYVKSPQALIKLAQTRGMILSACVEDYRGKIFEYSPNLVKSSAVGHGHADKESVRKFLDMTLGKKEYKTHDESDAVAVALCHIMNLKVNPDANLRRAVGASKKRSGSGLAQALAHKIDR